MRHRKRNAGFLTKEENIAIGLSGKVKNFTGKSPGVIKVQINDRLVTVHFKWFLTALEKKLLENCKDQNLVNNMRSQLIEGAKGSLSNVVKRVFQSPVKITHVSEELAQEKLSVQVEIGQALR